MAVNRSSAVRRMVKIVYIPLFTASTFTRSANENTKKEKKEKKKIRVRDRKNMRRKAISTTKAEHISFQFFVLYSWQTWWKIRKMNTLKRKFYCMIAHKGADERRPSSRKSQEMHYDNVYKATVCVCL